MCSLPGCNTRLPINAVRCLTLPLVLDTCVRNLLPVFGLWQMALHGCVKYCTVYLIPCSKCLCTVFGYSAFLISLIIASDV